MDINVQHSASGSDAKLVLSVTRDRSLSGECYHNMRMATFYDVFPFFILIKLCISVCAHYCLSMNKLRAKYPDIECAVLAVEPIVKQLRANPSLELEARFGVICPVRGFVAGVDRTTIDRIIDMMVKSPHVKGDKDWQEEQDFFFVRNGSQLRTRVTYDSALLSLQTTTIKKTAIATQNIGVDGGVNNMHIRVSLKKEEEITHVEPCVQTTLVRIKQRRRFTTASGVWAFDFSLTWSGTTKTDAEVSQSNDDPQFEVECELIQPDRELEARSDRAIALSLLLKMKDLLLGKRLVLQPTA